MSAPRVVVLDYGAGNIHSAATALERAGAVVEVTGNRRAASEADGLLLPGVGSFQHVAEQAARGRVGEIVGRRLAGGRPVLGICVGMQILFEAGLETNDAFGVDPACEPAGAGTVEGAATTEPHEPQLDSSDGRPRDSARTDTDADAGPASEAPSAGRAQADAISRRLQSAHDLAREWWNEPVREGAPTPGAVVAEETASGQHRAEVRRVAGLGEWPGEVTRLNAPILPHMGWSLVESPEGSALFDGLAGERFYFVHSYAARDLDLEPHPRARPILRSYAHYGERFLAAVENGPLSATQFHPEKSGAAGLRLLQNWVRGLRSS